MGHDEAAHYLMAPRDIPAHLAEHHIGGTEPPFEGDLGRYLEEHGIESTGNAFLDLCLVWHEQVHARDEQ